MDSAQITDNSKDRSSGSFTNDLPVRAGMTTSAKWQNAYANAVLGSPLVWDWSTRRDPLSFDNEQELGLMDVVRGVLQSPGHTPEMMGNAVLAYVRDVAAQYAEQVSK